MLDGGPLNAHTHHTHSHDTTSTQPGEACFCAHSLFRCCVVYDPYHLLILIIICSSALCPAACPAELDLDAMDFDLVDRYDPEEDGGDPFEGSACMTALDLDLLLGACPKLQCLTLNSVLPSWGVDLEQFLSDAQVRCSRGKRGLGWISWIRSGLVWSTPQRPCHELVGVSSSSWPEGNMSSRNTCHVQTRACIVCQLLGCRHVHMR